jgi:hypothetical protein
MTSLAATYDPVKACARTNCMAQEVNHGVQGDLMGYQEFVCMRQAGQTSGMRTYEQQIGPSERMAGDHFGAEYKFAPAAQPWIQQAGTVPCSQLQSMLDTPAYGLEGYQEQNRSCVQCPSSAGSGFDHMSSLKPAIGIKRIGGTEASSPQPRHLRPAKHSGDQSWMLVMFLLVVLVASVYVFSVPS